MLRSDTAAQLCQILSHGIGNVSITGHCADGVQRDFPNPTRLIEYDNLRSRELIRLSISARSEDWKTSAAVTFAPKATESVSLSVTAPDDELVLRVRSEILSLCTELRPWYSRIATLNFVAAVLLLVVSVNIGAGIGLIPITSGSESNSAESQRAIARAWAIAVALVAAAFALNWLRDRLFPSGVFAIGHGMERYRTQDTIRWVVVIGLGISILGSALVSLVAGA